MMTRTTQAQLDAIAAHRHAGDFPAAYNMALERFKLDPYHTGLWHELATCMMGVHEYERALRILEAVKLANPLLPVVPYQEGWIHEVEGRYEQAAERFEASRRLYKLTPNKNPDEARAWFGLGQCLFRLGEREKAEELWRQGLHWRCDTAQARYQRGMVKLALGQHTADAWADFEARWEIGHFVKSQGGHRKPDLPRWDGKAQGRVLVYAEQGSGDALMGLGFSDSVAMVSGVMPVVSVPDHTVTFAREYCVDDAVADDAPVPVCDFAIPSLSLPALVPMRPPLVHPTRPIRRVGVCWKGEPGHLNDRDRSCPIDFREYFASPKYEVVSLQYGKGFHPKDYLETAELMRTLDRIVTVDTSTVHLAGLLGIPTTLIPPTAPEWRWPIKGSRTAWYPSVTIERRKRWNEWEPALERIKRHLERAAAREAA